MGSKYKLLRDIIPLFPKHIDVFYDLFGGSGVVSINVCGRCNRVVYNDFNENVVNLLHMFKVSSPQELNTYFENKKRIYNLRTNSSKDTYMDDMGNYLKMRDDYNKSNPKDYRDLYLLSCYSINHLMRFNSNNEFNVSGGRNSYSSRIYSLIINAYEKLKGIELNNLNIFDFNFDNITSNDFVYLDPPYTNTWAVYNEKGTFGGWELKDDLKLFNIIDELNLRGVKFGLSNVFSNRGVENTHLIEWAKKYRVHHLHRHYHPFSTESSDSDEVYITNVDENPIIKTQELW